MKGSQTDKIKSIMHGQYANMITENTSSRLNGLIIGLVGGLIIGSLLKQNAIMTGIAGAAIGYVVSKTNK